MSTTKPDLYKISWQVDEPTYRQDPALSYSTLARFEREGFNNLDSLFDKVESPSLTFGSAVDALITGGEEEFNENFFVADFPAIGDSVLKMVSKLFNLFHEEYRSLDLIPTESIINLSEELKYQLNWKPETRAKVIREQGNEYYTIMYAAQGKTILSTEVKQQVDAAVKALKTSPATEFFFAESSPFDDCIERFYQLKFIAHLNNVTYRCMADLIVVDHKNKTIQPVDLKTSSHTEWDFYKSFIQWRYDIQARLYWRIIKANLALHEEFKEYTLLPYKFIVVNKNTLVPLVWDFKDTCFYGTLKYGKNQQIELRDPFNIGAELAEYLSFKHTVPNNINISKSNDLVTFINML